MNEVVGRDVPVGQQVYFVMMKYLGNLLQVAFILKDKCNLNVGKNTLDLVNNSSPLFCFGSFLFSCFKIGSWLLLSFDSLIALLSFLIYYDN